MVWARNEDNSPFADNHVGNVRGNYPADARMACSVHMGAGARFVRNVCATHGMTKAHLPARVQIVLGARGHTHVARARRRCNAWHDEGTSSCTLADRGHRRYGRPV